MVESNTEETKLLEEPSEFKTNIFLGKKHSRSSDRRKRETQKKPC
jgi:hypothetical protein